MARFGAVDFGLTLAGLGPGLRLVSGVGRGLSRIQRVGNFRSLRFWYPLFFIICLP